MTDPRRTDGDDPRERSHDQLVVIAVTVTRTGGIAGMRRTWRAQPDTAESPQWIALIDGCPWDAADPARAIPPTGADRFVWHVDARCGDAAREAALADPEVQGPWRELIDAVRSAQKAAAPPKSAR
jgi:hypothetical protein